MTATSPELQTRPQAALVYAALGYAGRGWPVIPLHTVYDGRCSCPKADDCGTPGKHPRTAHGMSDATVDETTIREWWVKWPDANIGIVTGLASGLLMIGPDGDQGKADLAALESEHGELPPTVTAASGSGGEHRLFWYPPDGKVKNRRNHLGTKIDIRGEGGYFVAAPSINENGPYRWMNDPDETQLAEAPKWLVDWCRREPERKIEPAPSRPSPGRIGHTIDPDVVVRRAVKYLGTMDPAISGQGGHDRTFAAAVMMVRGFDLGVELSLRILMEHYNPRCQPPWSEKELRHKCEDANRLVDDKPRGWKRDEERPGRGGRVGGTSHSGPVNPPLVPADGDIAPNEAEDDPHRLARLYLEQSCRHPDGVTLQFWRGEWHRWDRSAYRPVPEKEIRGELTASAKAEFDRLNIEAQQKAAGTDDKKGKSLLARKVSGRLIADVAHALASLTLLKSNVESPAWIGRDNPASPTDILACQNGLVHLPSFTDGRDYFYAATPRFFSPNALDFDFCRQASEPTEWLSFLRRLWPDDQQSIDALQDWFGYQLTPDTRQQKILLLVGPKRSGKGTIARVMRGLIGPQNMAGPTLAGLGTNFGLWPLLGKTAAVISDARLSGRTDTAVIIERLLAISGEDAQTIDRKNLPPVTAKLNVRFSILTNELPRLGDSSGALTGRMILLRLTKSWYGKEDIGLTDRLLGELPGILLWSIKGWQRLRERGHFIQPDDGRDLLSHMDDLASPVGCFVRQKCRVEPGARVAVQDLYAEWKRWCETQGRKDPGTEQVFGKDLYAAVPTVRVTQPRESGVRYRAYDGICVRDAGF